MARLSAALWIFAAALIPFAGVATAKPAAKAAVKHNWAATFTATAEGGFRMGDPAAPVKLVEYGSLACPHCRHFAETGYKPLVERYVRSGKVSYEFRNLLINGPDISVTLLARCATPAKFFAMAEAFFAAQPEWQKRIVDLSEAQKAEIEKMTDQQRIARFAEVGGMTQIAARYGVTPARARQCLADPQSLQRLLDLTKSAVDGGIDQTPTFIINGQVTNASTWEQLEPLLQQAGERG